MIQLLKDKSPQDIKINVHNSGPSNEAIHFTEVVFSAIDVRFKAVAKNKSEAKNLASREAVLYLESGLATTKPGQQLKAQKSFKGSDVGNNKRKASATVDENSPIDRRIMQAIYEAVHRHWVDIADNLSPEVTNYQVNHKIIFAFLNYLFNILHFLQAIAAFVAVSNKDVNNPQVLSIGTENMCHLASKLAMDGKIVHDSHAEVIARRALLCLLYDNLLRLLENQYRSKPEFILERNGKGFRLKPHLKLFLYLNRPPPGTAQMVEGSLESDKLHVKIGTPVSN